MGWYGIDTSCLQDEDIGRERPSTRVCDAVEDSVMVPNLFERGILRLEDRPLAGPRGPIVESERKKNACRISVCRH